MKLNNTFDINKLREWVDCIEIEAIPYHRYEQSDLHSIDISELYKYYQSALEMHKLFLSTNFIMQYNFEEYNNYNLVQKYVVAKYMYNQGIKGCFEFNAVLALVEVTMLCQAYLNL